MKLCLSNNYFSRRWHGQVPISVLLFRDTLGVGTLINLFASFLALVALAQGLHAGLALAIHFAPTPYNVFLLMAIQRSPDAHMFFTWVALVWFLVITIV